MNSGDSSRMIRVKSTSGGSTTTKAARINVGSIGRILYPLSPTRIDEKKLSSAVRMVVEEMKK
jgi:hypothetical protein